MIHTGYRVFGGPGATGGGELGVLLTGVAVWLLVDVPGVLPWRGPLLLGVVLYSTAASRQRTRRE
jgi:hypothetical protein